MLFESLVPNLPYTILPFVNNKKPFGGFAFHYIYMSCVIKSNGNSTLILI
jgi:hypothetical protein